LKNFRFTNKSAWRLSPVHSNKRVS